ncbi:hypothetical protein STEG23_032134, partial [Scotinomys teguina]
MEMSGKTLQRMEDHLDHLCLLIEQVWYCMTQVTFGDFEDERPCLRFLSKRKKMNLPVHGTFPEEEQEQTGFQFQVERRPFGLYLIAEKGTLLSKTPPATIREKCSLHLSTKKLFFATDRPLQKTTTHQNEVLWGPVPVDTSTNSHTQGSGIRGQKDGSGIRTPAPQLVLLFMEVMELSGHEGFLEEVRYHGEGFESLEPPG